MSSNDPGNSPWGRGKNNPPNIEDFLDQLQKKFNFNFGNKLIIWLVLAAVVALWAYSGFKVVNQGELIVVRRFGAQVEVGGPGLHFHPWPFEEMDVVKVDQIRSMELGFRTVGSGSTAGTRAFPRESLMITGDENLVNLQMVVQYRIDNLPDYLFQVWDPLGTPEGATLRDAAETALRGVVGSLKIDDTLTTGRSEIQVRTKTHLQDLMAAYRTGLSITEVKLQLVEAPEPVKAAFDDVVSAKEDRERIINEAEAYKEDILPKARGEAEKMLRAAEAYRENKIREAKGDTSRFLSMLREYRVAKTVTRRRLYLETMSEVLSKVDKVVISEKVSRGTLPLLPLSDLSRGGMRAGGGGGQ